MNHPEEWEGTGNASSEIKISYYVGCYENTALIYAFNVHNKCHCLEEEGLENELAMDFDGVTTSTSSSSGKAARD